MPHFIMKSRNRTDIDSKRTRGRFVYLQFVDTQRSEDTSLLEDVYRNWKNEDLLIIVIGDNLRQYLKWEEDKVDRILILSDEEKSIRLKFDISPAANQYFLFDKLGRLICSGENSRGYEQALKIQLLRHIKERFLSEPEVRRLKDDVDAVRTSIKDTGINLNGNAAYYIVSLFNIFCNSCTSGPIINDLKRVSKERKDIQVIGVLSGAYYVPGDLKALISQSQAGFPLIIADGELDNKWRMLIEEFNKYELNGIFFLMNEQGYILKTAYPGCSCYNEFFKYVNSL